MNQSKTLALLLLLYLICLASQRSSAASLLQAVRFLAEQVDTKPIQEVYINLLLYFLFFYDLFSVIWIVIIVEFLQIVEEICCFFFCVCVCIDESVPKP